MLWYAAPAADWEREALLIGNGALGAMVFGTLASERLQFNEKTDTLDRRPRLRPGVRPRHLARAPTRRDHRRPGRPRHAEHLDPEPVADGLGQPRIGYGAHQTVGDLHLGLPDAPTTPPQDYRRQLDLDNAVASVASPTKACATKGTSSPPTPMV